jgi:hypothetical protein
MDAKDRQELNEALKQLACIIVANDIERARLMAAIVALKIERVLLRNPSV